MTTTTASVSSAKSPKAAATASAEAPGRRAAQRNLPPNPNAPLAYLTGYRDYLRSAVKRG